LNFDDRLGALQTEHQALVLTDQPGVLASQLGSAVLSPRLTAFNAP
jgi:hypothetical protein